MALTRERVPCAVTPTTGQYDLRQLTQLLDPQSPQRKYVSFERVHDGRGALTRRCVRARVRQLSFAARRHATARRRPAGDPGLVVCGAQHPPQHGTAWRGGDVCAHAHAHVALTRGGACLCQMMVTPSHGVPMTLGDGSPALVSSMLAAMTPRGGFGAVADAGDQQRPTPHSFVGRLGITPMAHGVARSLAVPETPQNASVVHAAALGGGAHSPLGDLSHSVHDMLMASTPLRQMMLQVGTPMTGPLHSGNRRAPAPAHEHAHEFAPSAAQAHDASLLSASFASSTGGGAMGLANETPGSLSRTMDSELQPLSAGPVGPSSRANAAAGAAAPLGAQKAARLEFTIAPSLTMLRHQRGDTFELGRDEGSPNQALLTERLSALNSRIRASATAGGDGIVDERTAMPLISPIAGSVSFTGNMSVPVPLLGCVCACVCACACACAYCRVG